MPTMRTIDQAIAHIKLHDNSTCLTKHGIRQLVLSHQLPSVRMGTKYLICIETLETFLQGDLMPQSGQDASMGHIRKLSEKIT